MTKDTKLSILTVLVVSALCGYVFVPMADKPGQEWLGKYFKLNLGIDLNGGAEVTYRVWNDGKPVESKNVQSIAEVIRKRIDKRGLKEPKINVRGEDKIQIQIAGIDQAQWSEYKGIIERLGKLELMEVADVETHKRWKEQNWNLQEEPRAHIVLENPNRRTGEETIYSFEKVVLIAKPIVTGENVVDAYPKRTAVAGQGLTWEVTFKLDLKGGKRFLDATKRLAKKGSIAIVLDGKIESMPTVESPIESEGVIHGAFDEKAAKDLAVVLQTGSLAHPIGLVTEDGKFVPGKAEQESIVGPTLGQDAIQRGLMAVALSLIFVSLFMLSYYRAMGIMAVLTTLLNVLFLMTIMAFLGATLTLPGIAGIALTIGMAVDANILIAERIREEMAKGKTPLQAYEHGFNRAWITIMDANITTLIIAGVLYFFGTGAIKGFAITLAIGIITTLISVLWAGKHLMRGVVQMGWVKKFSMAQMFKNTNFDFVRVAKACVIGSSVVIALSLIGLVGGGNRALGSDFKGGTSISIRMNEEVEIETVRSKIRDIKDGAGIPKYEDAEVQIMITAKGADLKDVASFGRTKSREFQVRTAFKDVTEIQDDLQRAFVGTMNPEPFRTLNVSKETPFPGNYIFDRKINAGFTAFTKSDKPEEAAKTIKGMVADVVDKKEGQPYLEVRSDGTEGGFLKLNFYVAGAAAEDAKAQVANIQAELLKEKAKEKLFLPDSPFISQDNIGPAVAAELRNSTFWAMIISWILMILYIWVRFYSLKFGAAAVVALVHDSIISLGFVLLFFFLVPRGLGLNFELSMSTVAAILTIIGYSINDTIVIYDRIRENIFLMKRSTFAEIINASVNQTLSRSLLTSLTAWISAACMYVATMTSSSGASGLAFPLIVGFIVGSYSTIFIAAPILIWWYRGQRPAFERT
jgi:SecD/SecF fusion protein